MESDASELGCGQSSRCDSQSVLRTTNEDAYDSGDRPQSWVAHRLRIAGYRLLCLSFHASVCLSQYLCSLRDSCCLLPWWLLPCGYLEGPLHWLQHYCWGLRKIKARG